MPRISTFMYCEEAKPAGHGLQINNPLNTFTPAFIPGMYTFSVVIGIVGIDIVEKEYLLQLRFLGPDENEEIVLDTGGIVLKQKGNLDNAPLEAKGLMANLDFRNVVFKAEGMYRTEVFLDQELFGVFPIYVKGSESQ